VENEIEDTMVYFDKAIQERLISSGLPQNEIRIKPDPIEKQTAMQNISSSNTSPLRSGKLPIMATTAYAIKLGPYNITYSLEGIASYSIKKSGPSRMIQSEGPSFDLYSFEMSNNQSLGRINVEIRKFAPNMDRKTRHIEKRITDTLSSWGYEDITMSRRLFGGHRSGALGMGRGGEYDTIFVRV
jgi:hypothetical protein